MTETILVVEDEAYVRELISHTLQGAGYRVQGVADGESALRTVVQAPPDLIVLDVRLPRMDGWEVCRQVRLRSGVPILFLTGLAEEENVVKGLRLGGDDYLAKPFSPAVLSARVHALLRRLATSAPPPVVRLKGLSIDLAGAEVKRRGEPVRLTPTEFRILSALARQVGQVVTSRDLLRNAQGYDVAEAEAQQIVKVHMRHLRHLRQKIEVSPEHPKLILTVRGLGYMLNREELEGPA